MRHPTDGTLRRLVDEPVGVADADRRHVAGCPDCLTTLAAVRADAEQVHAALGGDGGAGIDRTATTGADVETAWRRLSAAVARPDGGGAAVPPPPARPRRWRTVLRSPAVAAVGAIALLAGAGTAAANDWFQVFSTEQVAALSITEVDLVELPDLSAYGDVEVTEQPDVHEVADAAAAAAESGLDVPAGRRPAARRHRRALVRRRRPRDRRVHLLRGARPRRPPRRPGSSCPTRRTGWTATPSG